MSSSKNYINLINKYDRVITLIDMDCFYCQVVEKLDKSLAGKPIAVVQYNEWKGGGIIAVNYVARAKGVTRHMRGDEAKEHCPEIQLVKVPVVRGKADLTMFREAGAEVAAVLQSFTPLLERASIDEAYLDITERVNARIKELNQGLFKLHASKFKSTYAVGYSKMEDFVFSITNSISDSNNFDMCPSMENESEHEIAARKRSSLKLLIGASVVNEIRAAVKEKTGYECSAGIAHNKIMAKLTAGMNKPNKQTVLPLDSISNFFTTLPVGKVKGLGGKFGEEVCRIFKVKNIGELVVVPKEELIKQFEEKPGSWLYLICRGIDLECVTPRYNSKSIGCCKRFPGANAITGIASLNHWLGELSSEICERLEKDQLENNRTAKQITISYMQTIGKEDVSSSRSVPLNHYDPEPIAKEALEVLKRNIQPFFRPGGEGVLNNPIKFLGLSVGKFQDNVDTSRKTKIQQLFENHQTKKGRTSPVPSEPATLPTPVPLKSSNSDPESNSSKAQTTLAEIMSRKIAPVVDAPDPKPEKPKSALLSIFESIKKAQLATSSTEERKAEPVPENIVPEPKKPTPFLKSWFEKRALAEENKAKSKVESIQVQETEAQIQEKEEHFEQKDTHNGSLTSDEELSLSPIQAPQSARIMKSPDDIFAEDTDEDEETNKPNGLITATSTQLPRELDFNDLEAQICEDSNGSEPQETVPLVPTVLQIDPQPSTSKGQTFHFDPIYITCDICNEKVVEDDFTSHKDFHIARAVLQQERESFRKSFSEKFSQSQSKPVKAKQKSGEQKLRPLALFLKKNLEEQAARNDTSDGVETYRCDECFKNIKVTEQAEHADYHVAKRLQSEMNRVTVPSSQSGGVTKKEPPAKRKKVSCLGDSRESIVPLTRFFKKN